MNITLRELAHVLIGLRLLADTQAYIKRRIEETA